MTPTFRLGRVAGIEVGANWSWLLVVALIVWSLAAGVFPDSNPGLSDGTYLAMAVVSALLFFLSLFLHELGHALQAQREGVAIDGITLWVFGGVARFRGEIPSARAELRIAAAGPAVSLVIGAVCLGLAILVPLPSAVDGCAVVAGHRRSKSGDPRRSGGRAGLRDHLDRPRLLRRRFWGSVRRPVARLHRVLPVERGRG
ncbi:MAG: peptidase [Solirubrobacterales bacterium]|nr:peptidase [Solirubrobacterales bacterium]